MDLKELMIIESVRFREGVAQSFVHNVRTF